MRTLVFAAVLLTAASACHKNVTVVKAIVCTDPCCAGDPSSIDCAENLNLQCTQADVACAGGRPYGCMQGDFFLSPLTTCEIEAGTDAGADAPAESSGGAQEVPDGNGDFIVLADAGAGDGSTEGLDGGTGLDVDVVDADADASDGDAGDFGD
jgi:hypothetical protein